MFIHVFFIFPETAGKTLEEVGDLFTNPSGPKYIATPAWRTHIEHKRATALEHEDVDPEKLAAFHCEERGTGSV